jgi:WD40 repeat protein
MSAELYDPATGAWSPTGSLNTPRSGHTATLLTNGQVLVAGGSSDVSSAELYDPATGAWIYTGNLFDERSLHTATLLPNGKVLITGGVGDGQTTLASAELYDPATGYWTLTGSLAIGRYGHTATLLTNGKVLVAGGATAASTELYDPATGVWSPTGSLATARQYHTATLLTNGQVLVVGGNSSGSLAELFDPATGTWSPTGSLGTELFNHTATLLANGQVLVAGGYSLGINDSDNYLASAELYDPAPSFLNPVTAPVKLGNGSLQFFFSGSPGGTNYSVLAGPNAAAPVNTWSNLGSATETPPGSGQFQFTDPQAPNYSQRFYRVSLAIPTPAANDFIATASMGIAREDHTATLLPNGKVLVAGGWNDTVVPGYYVNDLKSAELYDPATGAWTPTGSMGTARNLHTATLLPNGKVLVTGGEDGIDASLADAELYDPATGAWTPTGSMGTARFYHTATLLPNGKVLVAGGWDWKGINDANGQVLASAELYDPATGVWTPTASMGTARYNPTATLLPNGKVLVAGGEDSSAELYDPATGTWTPTGGPVPESDSATLLPNGQVLFVGGGLGTSPELYDPVTGVWSSIAGPVLGPGGVLLANGKVLCAGELYDPATGAWTSVGDPVTWRNNGTATLLPSGLVLFAGGEANNGTLASAELFHPAR